MGTLPGSEVLVSHTPPLTYSFCYKGKGLICMSFYYSKEVESCQLTLIMEDTVRATKSAFANLKSLLAEGNF